ncbi:PepSY-associated TM helix domain-containing protein [Acetobacter fabarum]|uniref:PepSY-associated TM helix domain-containing protein n=1 Tax=Acetobacter fabarum TaxID=483199 RepID=UPI00312BAD20
MPIALLKIVRPTLVRSHRYSGLFLAAILCISGLTGSIVVFRNEIDAALNPDFFKAVHPAHGLALSTLLNALSEQHPTQKITGLIYRPPENRTIEAFSTDTLQDRNGDSERDIFVDPMDGHIQGERPSEGCCLNRRAIMSFVYRLHYSLDLGKSGMWILGLSAILWSIDCVVGLFLTFPLSLTAERSYWGRWVKAWTISFGRSQARLVFDLHRAVSLWLWVILLGVAVSGVSLTLDEEIFQPVVKAIFPTDPPLIVRQRTSSVSGVSVDEAETIAVSFARARGETARPAAVLFAPSGESATFFLFSDNGSEPAGLGSPVVTVDLKSGDVTADEFPGRGRIGNLILQLQSPWHSGRIAGLTGRIMIALSGLGVCLLSVTGVMIWWRKDQARRKHLPAARRR